MKIAPQESHNFRPKPKAPNLNATTFEINRRRTKTSNIWSAIIFLLNIWTVLTTLLWASLHELPTEVPLLVHITIEVILFLEIVVRICLKNFLPLAYENFNLHHMSKGDDYKLYTLLLIGSFPFMTLYGAIVSTDNYSEVVSVISRMLLIKLIRGFEIMRAISKVEEILFYKRFKTLVFVKFVKNLMILLFVTHIFTCAWLLVQSSVTNHAVIKGRSTTNPFNTAFNYFERNSETSASLAHRYTDACLWAVGTLAACSFGDVTPRTLEEVILSLFTLLTGVVLLGMIFSDFASLMYLVDIEKIHARKQLNKAIKLCEILGVPFKIRYKIQAFYEPSNHAFSQTQYLSTVKELPTSLHTDIVLSLNRDVISKINVLNFGSPDLLIDIAKFFYPKVSMAGDWVIRTGDSAEEMFFIKQGEVEVLATDNKTQIAILREGAYFGEIGLLLTQKRTVSIRALTVCVFEVLNKESFLTVIDDHPEQKKLLTQVAQQRMKICTPADVSAELNQSNDKNAADNSQMYDTDTYDTAKELVGISRFKINAFELPPEPPGQWERFWKNVGSRLKGYACVNKDLDFRGLSEFIILPASKFFYVWTAFIGLTVVANFIIIPYEISFGLKHETMPTYWRVIDVIVVLIQFSDIFVHLTTTFKKNSEYVSKKDYIVQKYFNDRFIWDLIAFLPIDYITMAMNLSRSYTFWVKIIRFAKIPRFMHMLLEIRENSGKKSNSFLLILLGIFYVCLNHIAACLMHMIASSEYYDSAADESTLYKRLTTKNNVDMPLINQSPGVQYIYFIYWAFSVSSSGSFGDIISVTPFEKFFEIVTVLFFRVYVAFIAAEVASIFTSAYVSFKENLDKKTMYKKWMTHIKLPMQLAERVINYNEHKFSKYKGLDENQILAELPKTTRVEILDFLLNELLESVEIFPNSEVGLFSNIIDRFKFHILTKDEYVFRAGETAEEMYFIIDGEVVIEREEDSKLVATFKKNDFFGEMTLLDDKLGVRTKNARAKTNLTLAILSLKQLQEIWTTYPSVKENLTKITELRRQAEHDKESYLIGRRPSDESPDHSRLKKGDNISEFDQLRREIENSDFNNASPTFLRKSPEDLSNKVSPGISHSSADKLYVKEPDQAATKASGFELVADGTEKTLWEQSLVKQRPTSRFSLLQETPSKEHAKKTEGQQKDIESLQNIPEHKTEGNNAPQGQPRTLHPFQLAGLKHTKLRPKKKGVWQLIKNGWNIFEEKFKTVRPLILNFILFFDVMFAPLNIALEIATSGPMVYVELTFASILVLNFLLNLKDLIKNRKDIKKVFPAAIALAILNPKVSNLKPNQYDDHQQSHNPGHGDSHGHGHDHGHGHGGGHGHGHGHEEHEHVSVFTVCLDFIFMIPFTVAFHAFHVPGASTNVFLILIQLVKLGAVEHLTWIFQREFFKKRYALNNILMILYAFIILNHLCACLFIIIANAQEDFNYTWYAKVPAPQFDFPNNYRTEFEIDKFSIYIHATYWAYMTTSHIGVGDISAVSATERIYSSVVIMFSTFIYAFLFGNLASLVDDLTPKFQKEFEINYRNVLEYAKTSKLDLFLDKIHKYYNYIWQDNKGVDENFLLSTLPNSLRYDIFHARYEAVLNQAKFFQDQEGKYSPHIFYSFCKKIHFGVFMESDLIVSAGQEVENVYLILEGEAEAYDMDMRSTAVYGAGDHLGGVIANMTQQHNVKATKITKVAILDKKSFEELKEAYPEWYASLMKSEAIYKSVTKYIGLFKDAIVNKRSRAADSRANNLLSPTLKPLKPLTAKPMSSNQPRRVINPPPAVQSSRDPVQHQPSNREYTLAKTEDPAPNLDTRRRNLRSGNTSQLSLQIQTDRKQFSDPDVAPIEEAEGEGNDNNPWADLMENPNPSQDSPPVVRESNPPKSTFSPLRFRKKITYVEPNPHPSQSQLIVGNTPQHAQKVETTSKTNCFSSVLRSFASIFTKPAKALKKIGSGSSQSQEPTVGSFVRQPSKNERRGSKNERPSSKAGKSNTPRMPRKSIFGSLIGAKPSPKRDDQSVSEEVDEADESMDIGYGVVPKTKSKVLKKVGTGQGPSIASNLREIIADKKKLDAHMKSLKYYINPNSWWKTVYELIHTLAIIYSVFVVPIHIGFGVKFETGFIVMEVMVLLELIMYPIFLIRTAQYAYGILRLQTKQVWKKFIRKGFITYVIGTLPINLIFSLTDISMPVWLSGILSINRVLLVTKMSDQFAFFGSKYPQITRVLNIIKPSFYLAFVSNFISCLFSWTLLVEPKEDYAYNFTDYLELGMESLSTRYMISLDFILSIATTTGYPELIVYNDYERLILVLLVYLGDAVFALILGWYASNSTPLPEKYNYVFERIRKMEYILQEKRVPKKIRRKIENYFAYIVDTRNSNKSCLESLSGLLPTTTLKDMASEQAKTFRNIPFLRSLQNKVLSKEIIQNLKQCIYLPHDYIVSRNEYGSEMYCIAEGTVHMLSPNEKKVLLILHSGDFFGELAIYTITKRLTSFVAASFCIIYILDKEVLEKILAAFPQTASGFQEIAQQRLSGKQKKKTQILHHAFANLEAVANAAEATAVNTVAKLLRYAEVPQSPTKVKIGGKDLRADYSSLAPQQAARERFGFTTMGDDEELPLNSMVDDYIEDEEINHRALDMKKNSFRVKTKKRERRFSRLQMGREKSVSKSDGLTIKWGINFQ